LEVESTIFGLRIETMKYTLAGILDRKSSLPWYIL